MFFPLDALAAEKGNRPGATDVGRATPATRHIAQSGWGLWAVLTAVPWLLPTHSAPWTTFYQEILAATAALLLAAWAASSIGRWRIDLLAIGFACAALVPPLQAAAGLFEVPAEARLVSLYLLGFALISTVARHAGHADPGRLPDALFTGLAIAGFASTGMALAQWLGVDLLGDMLAPMPFHDRPYANVGQPNNLATLLVWGLIAMWWGHSRRHVGATGAVAGAAFLLVGVTLTQSRAGFLQVVLIGAVAWLARRRLRTEGQAAAFIGLGVWFIACTLALDPLTRLWTEQLARPMLNTDSPRERVMLLKTVLTAIGEHPWFGYGWNQTTVAHVSVADRYAMHGLIANSHNIVLELIVWNGLPLGVLMVSGLCAWFWRTARRARTPEAVLLLLALGTFTVHANLELPHVFVFFLMPVAVMMGTLSSEIPVPPQRSIPRGAVVIAVLCLGAVIVQMFAEYRRLEIALTDARMRAARIAGVPDYADPHVLLLRPLQDWMATLRVEPRRGMSDDELRTLRRTVTRYPSALGLLRYAQASAINGRAADARWALGVLYSIHAEATVAAAANDWRTLAAEWPPEVGAIAFPSGVPGTAR